MHKITGDYLNYDWRSRKQRFDAINAALHNLSTDFSLFVFTEKEKFEEPYNDLNSTTQKVYACKGDFSVLLDQIGFYFCEKIELNNFSNSQLKLSTQTTSFRESFVRQPESITRTGFFYQLTQKEFKAIPFEKPPVVPDDVSFMAHKLIYSLPLTPKAAAFLRKNHTPVTCSDEQFVQFKYLPFIKDGLEMYAPTAIHPKALELSIIHNLNELEFNVLNHFHSFEKSITNGGIQMYFDPNSEGIGWFHDRTWVKRKMKRLFELKLIQMEKSKSSRDERYHIWYFYAANQKFNPNQVAF